MGLFVVPPPDPEPWPTIGGLVCDFLEERAVYGPGSLQGEPYVIDPEFRAFIYRAYEVYPPIVTKAFAGAGPGLQVRKPHPWAGRRRFKRVGLSVRKGLAKTEKEALFVFVEIHPEAPARCDGFDAHGEPVGRPVRSPYVPMLAVTVDQVEELAFGALKYIVEEGPDADLFDSSLERIIRLDERGQADGKAVPLANSPGSRDGARTTLNAFDEPHRLYLPRQLQAHTTMDANLAKRPLEDPWSLYVGTAGQPGQGSIAENLHTEARQIAAGKIAEPRLFYLHRTDNGGHDLSVKAERIEAIREATGPAGEWGPGQFDDIAEQWDRPRADHGYLERVWLNRWVRSGSQFFDMTKVAECEAPGVTIPDRGFITLGFDGARFRDATALVATEIASGLQQLLGLWERPEDVEEWEVPEDEVTDLVEDSMTRYQVWALYADPPHWTETVGSWSARWPDQVFEWWTNRSYKMAYAHRAYVEAIDAQTVGIGGDDEGRTDFLPFADFKRHLGNTGVRQLKGHDDEGKPLYVMAKQDGREDLKFDAAMAASLSWTARLDAIKAGASPRPPTLAVPIRIR